MKPLSAIVLVLLILAFFTSGGFGLIVGLIGGAVGLVAGLFGVVAGAIGGLIGLAAGLFAVLLPLAALALIVVGVVHVLGAIF